METDIKTISYNPNIIGEDKNLINDFKNLREEENAIKDEKISLLLKLEKIDKKIKLWLSLCFLKR